MSNFIETIEGEEGFDIGDERVIDYDEAIAWGLNPMAYIQDIPAGVYNMKLIFKTWGKKASLNCFFKSLPDEKLYKIKAFTSPKNRYRYSARDLDIDFSEVGILENIYEIEIGITKTGCSFMKTARLVN